MGCSFHGQLQVGCCTIFDNDRFLFNRGLKQHPTMVLCNASNTCSIVSDFDETCPDPWYDVSNPVSEEIIGLYVMSMEQSNPFTRSTGETGCGGYAKPLRPSTREIIFRGIGLARGECAVELLKEWFLKNTVATGSCGGEQARWYKCCDRSQVRLAEGFLWTNIDITYEGINPCHGFEFEITAEVLHPFLFGEPVELFNRPLQKDECPIFAVCEDDCVQELPDQSCGCATEIPVETDTIVEDDCFCRPVFVMRECATYVPVGNLQEWVLSFTIQNGWTQESSWMRVRAWSDPNQLGSDKLIEQCYQPCVDMVIACLPKGGSFIFDGKANRSYVADRYGRRKSGRRLESASNRRNHIFGCKPITVCVEVDAYRSDPDISAQVVFEPRHVS